MRRRYRSLLTGPFRPPRFLAGRGFGEAIVTIAAVCVGLDYAIIAACEGELRVVGVFGFVLVSSLSLAAVGEVVIFRYRKRRRIIVRQRTAGAWSIGSHAPVNTNARLS
jgi:hypothetical protein